MQIGDRQWIELVCEGANRLGVSLTERQAEQFSLHAKELLKWNKKMNLTAIVDPFEMAVKHYIDSCACIYRVHGNRILDIGSGGGFPGIPLKIVLPEKEVTLIDSSRKKVSFLKSVVRNLKLEKTAVYQFRVRRQGGAGNFQNRFDVILGRALCSLSEFIEMGLPMLGKGGTLIALKGRPEKAEITDAVSALNNIFSGPSGYRIGVIPYELPFLGSGRMLVVIRCLAPIP